MKVFVFAYYSIKDPVFISATLNYLKAAAKSDASLEFYLLTFEHSGFPIQWEEMELMEKELAFSNIVWFRSKWRSGGLLKPLLKIYDLLQGVWIGRKIIRKNKCQLIFSEGVVGASIAHFISKLSGKPHLIHSFEPHADSMMEGGVWTSLSWEYRLLKRFERKLADSAVSLITSTDAYKQEILKWGTKANVYVIPSCVQTDVFQFNKESRLRLRSEYAIAEDEIVLVYLGKFGGMYMESELFQFFQNCELNDDLNYRYWIFTGDDHDWVHDQFEKYGIPADKTLVKKLSVDEVPGYLSAADAGVVAVRPLPCKRYCSPIKTGEYWACGLPIIVPKGVGDDYEMVDENEHLGLAVDNLEHFCLTKKLNRLEDPLLKNSRALNKFIVEWESVLYTSLSTNGQRL